MPVIGKRMEYGLKTKIVKQINNIFAKYEDIDEVVLYGSRAKGNYKPGSDIDLVLKGDKINLKLLNKISLDLDNLLLPYSFDLAIFHHISNCDLLEHIDRVEKIFYKK